MCPKQCIMFRPNYLRISVQYLLAIQYVVRSWAQCVLTVKILAEVGLLLWTIRSELPSGTYYHLEGLSLWYLYGINRVRWAISEWSASLAKKKKFGMFPFVPGIYLSRELGLDAPPWVSLLIGRSRIETLVPICYGRASFWFHTYFLQYACFVR